MSNKVLIWGGDYLHSMLMFNYICTEIVLFEEDCRIFKLEKKIFDIGKPILVEYDDNKYLLALENDHFLDSSRGSIYGLKSYSRIAVKKNYISGFERFPDYSTCCIYSPFSEKGQVEELMNITKDLDNSTVSDIIRKKLSEYITPYLMQVIKTNNINETITEEEIREEYVSMISDFVRTKRTLLENSTGK